MLRNLKDKVTGMISPVARIPAVHNNKTAERSSNEDADGLSPVPVLYLARQSKVMLIHNIWTSHGLVNGSRGTVIDILCDHETSSPTNLPSVILCSFKSYTGPSLLQDNKIVPVYPVTTSWVTSNGG